MHLNLTLHAFKSNINILYTDPNIETFSHRTVLTQNTKAEYNWTHFLSTRFLSKLTILCILRTSEPSAIKGQWPQRSVDSKDKNIRSDHFPKSYNSSHSIPKNKKGKRKKKSNSSLVWILTEAILLINQNVTSTKTNGKKQSTSKKTILH